MTKLGYVVTSVKDDHGERHKWFAHRFVYLCFEPDFDQTMEIDHIDGDRSNNSISNLQALTKEEHIQKTRRQLKVPHQRIKPPRGGCITHERWYRPSEAVIEFLGVDVGYVSDMGRVSFSGRQDGATYGNLWENGVYMYKNVSISRIVCASFHGPPPGTGFCARHLNGNMKDNRLSNVAWSVTPTGAYVPPACWATPMDNTSYHEKLAVLLTDGVFDTEEQSALEAGQAVFKYEEEMECAWAQLADTQPTIYDTFKVTREQSVLTRYKNVLKLFNFTIRRRTTNMKRPNYKRLEFTLRGTLGAELTSTATGSRAALSAMPSVC